MTQITRAAAQQPLTFTFEPNTVRVILRDGEPWFVAADVCAALEIGNSRMAMDRLDDDEKGVSSTDTPGGIQQLTVINEPGLYSLILGSRKPSAKRFKRWVVHEVLPAIRKTGSYTAPAAPRPRLSNEQRRELEQAIRRLGANWYLCTRDYAHQVANHLRVAFSVRSLDDLRPDQFEAALALVNSKRESVAQLLDFLADLRKWVNANILSGGEPWTPSVKAALTRQLEQRVELPPDVDWQQLARQVGQAKAANEVVQ